jgi:hypothetical protein
MKINDNYVLCVLNNSWKKCLLNGEESNNGSMLLPRLAKDHLCGVNAVCISPLEALPAVCRRASCARGSDY